MLQSGRFGDVIQFLFIGFRLSLFRRVHLVEQALVEQFLIEQVLFEKQIVILRQDKGRPVPGRAPRARGERPIRPCAVDPFIAGGRFVIIYFE